MKPGTKLLTGLSALCIMALPLTLRAATPEENTPQKAAQATQEQTTMQPGQALEIIQDWPESSKQAANTTIQKYGEPDGVTPKMLVWENNGPWKRTIVYKEPIDHNFPMPHTDVIEQTIAYNVPASKFDDLAEYDGSVIVKRTAGEISAMCDKEGANFLALNLANDVVEGSKTVDEARQAYAETIRSYMQGEMPDNMQRLTFKVDSEYTGDPGKAVIETAAK